ncbi:MAG: glycosyltransferase family 4 protein [Candidatus Omnitrophota bacterium]|nr:glycosyltransferase family 4 protein [Candidatus Omnitrophota bacterium]
MDKFLKIAIFNEFYPPDHLGGAERTAQLIYETMSGRGHDVSVLSGYVGRPSVEDRIYRKIPRYNDPRDTVSRLSFLRKLNLDTVSYFIARDFLKRGNFSVFFVRSVRGISFRPVMAALRLKIPVVFFVPDDWLAKLKTNRDKSSIYNHLVKKYLYGDFDFQKILCPSRKLFDDYLKAGFKEEKLLIVPHGVDTHMFRPVEKKDSSRLANIIYVGRLFPSKGVHVLVEAARILKVKGYGFQVQIIGKGNDDYEKAIKSDVENYGLKESFVFRGMVPQRDLPEYYRQADIAVIPSLEEPFGITLIEAMASGLPVVASRVDAIPENVNDGMDGVLVDPNNPASLAGTLGPLIEDRGKRLALGGRARQKAVQKFSLERFIDKIETLLIEIAQG